MDEQIKNDTVWERKTKPFKSQSNNTAHPEGKSWARLGFDDPYSVLGEMGTKRSEKSSESKLRRLTGNDRKAAEILRLKDEKTKSEIRKKYKALVKDLHPDMNSGSRDDEERLAEVVWAWEQINKSIRFKE